MLPTVVLTKSPKQRQKEYLSENVFMIRSGHVDSVAAVKLLTLPLQLCIVGRFCSELSPISVTQEQCSRLQLMEGHVFASVINRREGLKGNLASHQLKMYLIGCFPVLL